MTFDERYGDEPDYYYCHRDMMNIADTLTDKADAAWMRGALWACHYWSVVTSDTCINVLDKLWENMRLDDAKRLPGLVSKDPP